MTKYKICDYPECGNDAETTVQYNRSGLIHSYCRGHAGNEIKNQKDAQISD